MNKRVDQLENSLLELGTEMFRLKHRLIETNHNQEQIVKSLQALKELLNEKGLVTSEEFDCAADLIRLIEKFDKSPENKTTPPPQDTAKKELH